MTTLRGRTDRQLRVRLTDAERRGRAVDLTDTTIRPEAVAAAVRNPDDDRVMCPDPTPVHEHVGRIGRGDALDRRAALAAVARSLGHEPPQRERIEALREELAAADPPTVDVGAARERVAAAGADVERLRERVATLRGRVQALREADADASDAERALETATRQLSEAETERTAAEQALDRARARAREARDARDRQLARQDRLANLERAARADLSREVCDRVDAAVRAVPGGAPDGIASADPVTTRLGLARVADLAAPIVLACRQFPDADAAAAWLDAPVLRL